MNEAQALLVESPFVASGQRVGLVETLVLDGLLRPNFEFLYVTADQQRHGIDRVVRDRESGVVLWVEYQVDRRAAETGNVFVETLANDVTGRLGWAYTSRAEVLICYIPAIAVVRQGVQTMTEEVVLWVWMSNLRRQLDRWVREYRSVKARHEGYNAEGVVVPLEVFVTVARRLR